MNQHVLREVYRYLGYGKKEPSSQEKAQIESCIEEVKKAASFRFFYRSFPLSFLPDGSMETAGCRIASKNLRKNLDGCTQVIFFAATLGSGVDVLLRRYSSLSVSKAVIIQAAAAALLEEECNEKNQWLKEQYASRSYYLRPRFSPGYGDFPLAFQKDFFRVMNCQKEIGLSLTDSLFMAPSKSVTALIGLSPKPSPCILEGCEVCEAKNCPYRR